ncbi:MAG: ferritin-like domain-containing protein [Sphingomicrobium sp.]
MQMRKWFERRYFEVVSSIYIYNEHRGYTALDRVLDAVRRRDPDDHELHAMIEQHRADERKHYWMFRRWFEKRGIMPLKVDRTCGHIDRFVEILFRTRINELTEDDLLDDENFAKLCRVISLTEQRGYRQVEILLDHSLVKRDPRLVKIFRIIKEDEPSHWAPYERWLKLHGKREPVWWERAVDSFVHSELLFIKLPLLFVSPWVARRTDWADEYDGPDAHDAQDRTPGDVQLSNAA